MAKRKRRSFTAEFKAETVRLVLDGGKTIPEIARLERLSQFNFAGPGPGQLPGSGADP